MYEQYLKALLAPLGVYDLSDGSISGAELAALGGELDRISAALDLAEQEGLLASAENQGLDRWEALFARRPAAVTPEQRREAIAALLRIAGDSLTPDAIGAAIQGCGIKAQALETGGQTLRILFPGVVGRPPDYAQIQKIILDILPCHLGVEFYLRFLTWEECHQAGYTWGFAGEKTWLEFMSLTP